MMKPRREAFHKLRILKYAEEIGSVVKTCRYFGVGRASFYRWKNAYERFGKAGMVDRRVNVMCGSPVECKVFLICSDM